MTRSENNTIELDNNSNWSESFDLNASLGVKFAVQDKQFAIDLIQRGMKRGCVEPLTSFQIQIGKEQIDYLSIKPSLDCSKAVSHLIVRTQQNDRQMTSLFLTGNNIKLDAIRKAIRN